MPGHDRWLIDSGFRIYTAVGVYPEVAMQVGKWGNSLAVRLPASVVDALALREGDEIEIHLTGSRAFGVARAAGRDGLLARLRAYRGRLPADFRFDRDAAHER